MNEEIIKIYLYAKRLALYSDLENERNNIYNELNNRSVTCIFSKAEIDYYSWKPMGSFLCLFESGDVTLYIKDNQGAWLPISVNAQDLVDNGFDYSYEDPNYVPPVTITVEPFGDGYGFDLNEDGYYVNNNSTMDQTYAMCKIVINNTADTDQTLKFKLNQLSENGCDFGMFSVLNTDLVANVDDINTNVAISFQNYNGDIDYNIGVPVGESYVTVKYKKDGSDSQQTDTFKFKLAQDNHVTETRHMAMKEDSDWIKIEVETRISGVLNPSSNVANVNLKPEEAKFEELIALVRKGIYKNIVLTDGFFSCFMCLEEVAEEGITYTSLYPIKSGARGYYYRSLNFNFDESGVLTTLTLSRHGARFLTASETGSWTLDDYTPVYKKYVDDTINEVTSNGYTKAEIDAMIGEIDTVLDDILNEPELVQDDLEVPDVG